MIKVMNGEVEMGGPTAELCSETVAVMQMLREILEENESEIGAKFLFSEVCRLGKLTEEEALEDIKAKEEIVDKAIEVAEELMTSEE